MVDERYRLGHHERVKLTLEKYPTLKELKLGVLKGEYNDGCAFFSREFLWKTVCLNSYKVEFHDDELKEVPDSNPSDDPEPSDNSKINDPLTDDSTDWKKGENDILNVIKLDVERLIIDPIFQDEDVKRDIVEILYNYDKFTPYKQGFHEICGLVYLTLHKDTIVSSMDSNAITKQEKLIKIETFNIFTGLMLSVVPNFYIEDNLIGWCLSTFNKFLALVDPVLFELLLKRHKIESQIWLIRWVRLIFMRELGTENSIKILDFLISYDHDLCKLIPFIIILLLIKIKLRLVESEDNGEVISLLLHYPSKDLTNDEIKELMDLSIKLYRCEESKLQTYGIALNKKYHKGYNWDKIKDLDRLRMEMKLKRRVTRALQKQIK